MVHLASAEQMMKSLELFPLYVVGLDMNAIERQPFGNKSGR